MKSEIRITYPATYGNRIMEILLLLLMAGSLFFNLQIAPRTFAMVFWIIFGIVWGINFVRFQKNIGIGFVKCCSLQLIVCGLLGAIIVSLINQFVLESIFLSDIITIILMLAMLGINILCYQEKRTVYYITFLLFPYCFLSAEFFLLAGFLSTILLLIAFFSGTLMFEHQKMDDDEYFGNSHH